MQAVIIGGNHHEGDAPRREEVNFVHPRLIQSLQRTGVNNNRVQYLRHHEGAVHLRWVSVVVDKT